MDDDPRRRADLDRAPTAPAPPEQARPLAVGTDRAPDATLDMPADEQRAQADPTRVGRFVVRARLGVGGMGVVYAGEDVDLGRSVAIKVVRGDAEHPAYRARLLREAQAMARLEHRNVVRVYEVGEAAGRLFVAMELVEGTTLARWMQTRHSWREVLAMFEQAGEGLAAVHRAGLVHRDFKPDNVLVDRGGHARVADFGLARFDAAAAAPLTRTGVMMGTPGYMAPEQQLGTDVDARADQYSFCVALREALAGRPVEDARWREVPERVRAAISRGLSYDPDERFPSLTDLLAALRAGAATREPRWQIALVVLGVLGLAAGVVAYAGSRGSQDGPSRAVPSRDARLEVAVAAPAPAPGDAAPGSSAVVADAAQLSPAIDAGARRAPQVVPAGSASPLLADAAIDFQALRTPAANAADPSHLPAVRATIRGIGYDGIDEVSDANPAFAQIQAAMKKRRGGDCATATKLWQDANAALARDTADVANGWAARAWLGRALCALADGHAPEAIELATHAFVHGNQDEVRLVMAIASYDKGERESAHAMMVDLRHRGDAHIQAALDAWLAATGLVL